MKFLYILEGKIGRIDLDVTNKDIIGLCTDNITSCNIVILISANKKRYVLIHGDLTVTSQMIADEIAWIGSGGSHFILRRDESGYKTQPSVVVQSKLLAGIKDKGKFTQYVFGKEGETVYFVVGNDSKPIVSAYLPANVEYHPQAKLLFAKGVETEFKLTPIYEMLGYRVEYSKPLLFNAEVWTDYGSIDLSQFARDRLKERGITETSSAVTIFKFFAELMSSSNDDFILQAAAKVCSYFYLKSAKIPSISDFLNVSYTLFIKEQKITNAALLKKIEACKKSNGHLELLAIRDTITDPHLNFQTTVLVNAIYMMLVRFTPSDSGSKVEAKEAISEKQQEISQAQASLSRLSLSSSSPSSASSSSSSSSSDDLDPSYKPLFAKVPDTGASPPLPSQGNEAVSDQPTNVDLPNPPSAPQLPRTDSVPRLI